MVTVSATRLHWVPCCRPISGNC